MPDKCIESCSRGTQQKKINQLDKARDVGDNMLDRYQIEEISQEHINQLISAEVGEGQTLEYKEKPYDNRDEGTVKLLKSVIDFANTDGGYLIIGVQGARETKKMALTPFDIPDNNADKFQVKMEQKIESNIEPILTNFRVRMMRIESRFICIICIKKSFFGPHRLRFGKNRAFISALGHMLLSQALRT